MKPSGRRLLAIVNVLNIFLLLLLTASSALYLYLGSHYEIAERFKKEISEAPAGTGLKFAAETLQTYTYGAYGMFKIFTPVLAIASAMAIWTSVALWRSAKK